MRITGVGHYEYNCISLGPGRASAEALTSWRCGAGEAGSMTRILRSPYLCVHSPAHKVLVLPSPKSKVIFPVAVTFISYQIHNIRHTPRSSRHCRNKRGLLVSSARGGTSRRYADISGLNNHQHCSMMLLIVLSMAFLLRNNVHGTIR